MASCHGDCLNVVLTRSQSSDITTGENVVICGSIPSALELLTEVPYCFSIKKVFVIQLWYSSKPLKKNNVWLSFATYVRVRFRTTDNYEVKDLSFLPRMIVERRDE
ncbi:bifunctional dihydrofolate reductase-thymidylate synthase-like [Gossypium australe]|uniref:Bifunctional dihydrofolate reductase-thymidylate synthase-like n=1 Tax=Gossypium australe TaxID=47621 RepID=A0A5B6V6B6_9ROSI|nr:bifunctional dihydrofolate reductase-thymidylate synthase-like [Gossypium australe]